LLPLPGSGVRPALADGRLCQGHPLPGNFPAATAQLSKKAPPEVLTTVRRHPPRFSEIWACRVGATQDASPRFFLHGVRRPLGSARPSGSVRRSAPPHKPGGPVARLTLRIRSPCFRFPHRSHFFPPPPSFVCCRHRGDQPDPPRPDVTAGTAASHQPNRILLEAPL